MKLHRILVEAVAKSLDRIFTEKKYADDVVENIIASDKRWGARDRNFIAESIYDIVRNHKLYAHCAQSTDALKVIEARFIIMQIAIPAWDNFGSLDSNTAQSLYKTAQQQRVLKYSIPDWLDAAGEAQMGTELWEKEMAAMHTPAKVCLRVNTLKTTLANAKNQLKNDGIETVEEGEALIMEGRKNILHTTAYKSGWVEVQDANSQSVAKVLNPQPGEFVIDACAGAGGKTLQLAALMKNKGNIYALDVYDKKLIELQKRAHRAGAKIIKCALVDFTAQNFLFEKADKLLLDVPCTGLGVLRRNPDTKWKLTASILQDNINLQWEILSSYHSMLKKGGELLYTTCSILPCENQQQVQRFLAEQNGKFTLVNEYILSPSQTGFDGFYMALLKKG
jgi:16S rRNA (cytosine967-C5)-methyltransferase